MGTWMIVGDVLIGLTAAFSIYLTVVMAGRIRGVVLKKGYIQVFRYQLIVCAVFMLFALDVRFGLLTAIMPGTMKALGWVLRAIVALATAAFLGLIGKIALGGFIRSRASAQNAIVLGLALENGQPTVDLMSRLDRAERYWKENPQATLILTGGNPDEGGRTEAAVMFDILIRRGVPAERMILEDQAETTRENFRNTARLIDPGASVALITSDYHMDRAVLTARGAGFAHVLRLPAPSSVWRYGANVMWEVVLELNELTLKR